MSSDHFLNLEHESGNKSSKDQRRVKDDDQYDTRSEVSSSDDENHSQISNPSLSSASFKSGSGNIFLK